MLLNAQLEVTSFGQLFPRQGGHGVRTLDQMVLQEPSLWLAASLSPLARQKTLLAGETYTSFTCGETSVSGQRAACKEDTLSPSPRRLGAWFLHAWLQGSSGLAKSCSLIQPGLRLVGGTGE